MPRRALIIGGVLQSCVRKLSSTFERRSALMSTVEAGKKCAAYKAVDEWLRVGIFRNICSASRMDKLLVSAVARRLCMPWKE